MIPFKGYRLDRPYPPSGLTTALWERVPILLVGFADLWLTQDGIKVDGLFGERHSTDTYPHVVKYEKQFYLEDGHHRVVLAALNGNSTIRARLLTNRVRKEMAYGIPNGYQVHQGDVSGGIDRGDHH